eukprot:CAMPEP_0118947968 /NCGR_PEP_ID=MMETSP1169-20130426/47005_1 /TAXON_ID=36882 /ORGANISM="Pyramimonas obovata, Strain CCMP722" /LENGTH=122 /DNA_ID=CAMNT_0006894293 /DNA_START=181 /DNA_END=546 /DNA_ORIENTATION=-
MEENKRDGLMATTKQEESEEIDETGGKNDRKPNLKRSREEEDTASGQDQRLPPMNCEKAKMLAGELYQAFDSQLTKEREVAHSLVEKFNDCKGDTAVAERLEILKALLGSFPADAPPYIEPK